MERKPERGDGAVEREMEEQKIVEKERERLQSHQVLQAQKMEAIGTLTGGIAHDYNNLLTIIMGNLFLAQEEVEPHSPMAELLGKIEEASSRARDLTHQLMCLSQGGYPLKERGSIEMLLREIPEMVRTFQGVECILSIRDDLLSVPFDTEQMHYAMKNIVINAAEAMPQGGVIIISSKNLTIESLDNDSLMPLKEGKYVMISVQDGGRGIPEQHMDRIFDPYFSTKERGVQKGMGLGLATAYAIVQKHAGHIAVQSAVGVGTTVNICLPALEQETMHIGHDEAVSQSMIVGQQIATRRILVMDDEESLRNLYRKMLEKLGYESNTVKDGMEAIQLYKKSMDSGRPFAAVILDLTIKGGMGGDQAIRELLRIDPNVKAIVCSGYFNDPVLSRYTEYGFRGAISKPYQKDDLECALRKILDNPLPSARVRHELKNGNSMET